MLDNSADRIARHFAQESDGELFRLPRLHPYSVTAPTDTTRSIIYTTKPALLLGVLERGQEPVPFAVVGRAGLPNDDDVTWLRSLAQARPMAFLGDADPADLLVYTWLRAQIDVEFRGLSDSLLDKPGVSLNSELAIPFADSESRAAALLDAHCPDHETLIGPRLATLMRSGQKLELEAGLLFGKLGAAQLCDVLDRDG